MKRTSFEIDGRQIGDGAPPYVIAEIGINHGGNLETAISLMEKAKECGADAAKLQAFVPEKLLSRSSPYFDLLVDCALGADAVATLMKKSREIGLTLFSAVFDEESADLLAAADAQVFKIASGDLTHLPLVRHVAALGKPMLISTGGSTMEDIAAALEAVEDVSAGLPVALFHCVSNYPTKPTDANLACMATMRAQFGVPVGFSDHTLGGTVPVAAAAIGAELIEKHFTFDKEAEGPDHLLSSDPDEMAIMTEQVRMAFEAIGSSEKKPVEPADLILQIRRSVTASCDIPQGAEIERGMLEVKRPGTGISPAEINQVIGKKAARDIGADETLEWGALE